MSSAIALFQFENHDLRFVGTADQPEWVAADVVDILYSKADKRNRRNYLDKVPAEWKGHKLLMTLGGEQDMVTLYEPGLYHLICRSDSSLAIPFQRWVFEEVLPSIRKTGGYGVQPADPFAHPDIQQFHELLLDGDLKASEMRLLLMLRQLMAEGSFEDVTYTTLTTRLGINQSTFYRAVGRLRELGIVDLRVQRMMSVSIPPQLYAVD